ncbi:MAG TPA: hypothetical protein DCO77_00440 [Nitrospiraceae bacterium]|nr:hypothetical protein [Nitrospiraceae bacterium]
MKSHALSMIIMLLALSGCHTSASFILPPNTDLMINGERVSFDSKDKDGRVKFERRPLFWTSIAGIEYMLLEDDNIVKKGRLPSGFRISSIFWPPYAYIYWPVGFRFKCYDLSDTKKKFIEKCGHPVGSANKNAHASQTTQ